MDCNVEKSLAKTEAAALGDSLAASQMTIASLQVCYWFMMH